MFLPLMFKITVSVVNTILGIIFGNKYKKFISKSLDVFNYISYVISTDKSESENQNSFNDKFSHLDANERKLIALQNQVISLQRQVEELKAKLKDAKAPLPAPRAIPPPPPPPPPAPAIQMISKAETQKVILKAVRALPAEEAPLALEPKRPKPSSIDLIQRKQKLRSTTVRRSPGGTPLTHWKNQEISSPEDDFIANVMKKALKRKFKNLKPFSPPSPADGSDGECDFSF